MPGKAGTNESLRKFKNKKVIDLNERGKFSITKYFNKENKMIKYNKTNNNDI